MECGKLTAKLRDAVPVCFIVDGKEVKRYKNIEIPDEVKKLPFKAFDFNVPLTGAITFKISFEPGVLPEVWPEKRQRKSRAAKAAEEEIPANVTKAIQHALEQAEAEGQPVQDVAEAAMNGAEVRAEVNGPEIIITAEDGEEAAESTEPEEAPQGIRYFRKGVKSAENKKRFSPRSVRHSGWRASGTEDSSQEKGSESEGSFFSPEKKVRRARRIAKAEENAAPFPPSVRSGSW